MTNELEKLKTQLSEANGIIKYLEEQNKKRVDLSLKQTELEIRRLEAKKGFTVKDCIFCFILLLAFLFGCYTVHEHFLFLRTSLIEETVYSDESVNHIEASGISQVHNSQIGTITVDK